MKPNALFRGICAVLLLLLTVTAKAQDPQFSQSYLSRLYLNPATTGSERGTTLFLNYRSQWNNLPNSFNTVSIAVDAQSPRFSSGFGVHAYYDSGGPASIQTSVAGLTYAYIVRINENFNIHFGLGTAYVHKSINTDELNFSSEIDPMMLHKPH